MSLTLTVDGDRWRAHLRSVRGRHPGLVPVTKGNGYGLGNGRLARKAAWLGVDTLAVGTYEEIASVEQRYDGSILVLTPFRPFHEVPAAGSSTAGRVVHTVGRLEDLAALAARGDSPRVVVEVRTSMRRHGFTGAELRRVADSLRGLRLEGVTLHLPMTDGNLAEVERLMVDVIAAGLPTRTVLLSHLTDSELDRLLASYPDFTVRPRLGTSLWLGDRNALTVTARVLDAHRVRRGEVYGYRGRRAPRHGTVLVVSGGTAHGIGLEAPSGAASLRARAARVAKGGLDAAGFALSPYLIGGKQRFFAEPPHMQASMLFVPEGVEIPTVGDPVPLQVRFTTTTFDRILLT